MAATSVVKILESVQNSYSLTRTLGEIQLWREEDGSPFYCVGNSVVLFKIRHCGEWCAMRCYLRCVPNLKEIYGERYLPGELYVYTGRSSGYWVDVVLERWVDGQTLKSVVERCVERGDCATLRLLADKFDTLADELLRGDWAHGDLTTENILVTPEMQLRLIDFDCKYLPSFAGRMSPELGTAAYQPPSRSMEDFDNGIDDYSVALISTALRVLSVDYTLYHKCGFYDGFLYDPMLISRGRCKALDESMEIFLAHNMVVPYRIAALLSAGMLRIAPLKDILHKATATSTELILTMKHGYVGYSTPNGECIIPHIYDDGLEFREEAVMVKLANRWLAIDPTGEVIMIFNDCETVKSFKNGVARVLRNGAWLKVSRY